MNLLKKIKLLLLSIAFVSIPILTLSSTDAISIGCDDREWFTRNNPGFSVNSCRNGIAFPVFNAFVDYDELHFGIPGDERRFTRVRLEKRADDTVPNFSSLQYEGYTENLTLQMGDHARTYVYLHNNADPSRNSTGSSLARNVKLRALGFTKDLDGLYYLRPTGTSNQVRLTTRIESSNTIPPTREHSVTINLPANSKLQLRTDQSTLIRRTPCWQNGPENCQTPPTEFANTSNLVNSQGLTLTNNNSGIAGEFFGSQGYRMHVGYYLTVVPDTDQVCRSLNITRTTGDLQFGMPAGYSIQISPDLPEFRNNLRSRIVSGPGSHQPTVVISNRPNSTGNPTAIIGQWRDGTQVEFFVNGQPCRQLVQFPPQACTRFDLSLRDTNPQANTATFRLVINSSLNNEQVLARLNGLSLINQRIAFTAQPSRNSLGFSNVSVLNRGALNPFRNSYEFTVSEVAGGKSFRVVLPGFEESCNAEYTFSSDQQECIAFDIERTIQGQESIFRVTNLQPPTFSGNVEWSITRPTGGGTSSVQRTISQTLVVQNSLLPAGTVVRARLVDPSTGSANCSGEITIPTDGQACINISITPRTANQGQTPNFNLEDIRPNDLGGQVTWQIIDNNNNGAVIQRITQNLNQSFTPSRPLLSGQEVKVSHSSGVPACEDSIPVEDVPMQDGLCTAMTQNRPDFSLTRPTTLTVATQPRNFPNSLTWTVNLENGSTQDFPNQGNQFTLNPDSFSSPPIRVQAQLNPDLIAPGATCNAVFTPTDQPPTETRVCTALNLIDVNTGISVTNLPTPGRILNVDLSTVASGFEDQVRITSATNTSVFRQQNQLWIFTTSPNASLTLGVPGQPCNWQANRTDPNTGNEVKLKKEIQDVTKTGQNIVWSQQNYTFANVGQNIQYRLTPDFGNLNFPTGTTFTLTDTIQNEITGLRRGANKEAITVAAAKLSLVSNSPRFPAVFNLNQLSNLTRNGLVYTGSVNWPNRVNECNDFTGDCSVQFPNRGRLTINFPGSQLMPGSSRQSDIIVDSNTAHAIVVCPFVVSRGFGEVFLEERIQGANLASCGLRNTQSPVFTPAPEQARELATTGAGEQIVAQPTHGICEAINRGDNDVRQILNKLPELSNFSSATCQTALISAERWQREQINQSLINTFSRLTENASLVSNINNEIPDSLGGRNRISVSNNNLTVGSNSPVVIQGNSARTIVVRNGNLNINSNITYQNNSRGVVAFVVIGGDIIISPGVTEINGIFVTIPHNNAGGSFLWERQDTSNSEWTDERIQPLEIRGSAYGNINPLIQASASGNLAADRGGVSVLFDGRITRRIPPGLQDVIKFNQFQVATQSQFFSSPN